MKTNPTARNAADLGETAARIVRAARKCFERYGFAKTTMDDIAREAGISRPTIYNYFPGKAEILDHIGFEELENAHTLVRQNIDWRTTFAEFATETIVISVVVSRENPYIRRFVESLDVDLASDAPSNLYETEARIRWERILARARAANELAPDLDKDDVFRWISSNIATLLKSFSKDGADEAKLRYMVRRFVIEPLLSDRKMPQLKTETCAS